MDAVTAQQRTMKDFLELYNKMVYHCFDKCVSNFNHAKTSDEEANCVNACADKCIGFNQRHMMVFVEHQNTKHKLAAQAAESQTPSPAATMLQDPGATTLPGLAENMEQESSTLTPESTALPQAEGETATPENVCWRMDRKILPRFAVFETESSDHYKGKSIVEQFVGSRPDKLKPV